MKLWLIAMCALAVCGSVQAKSMVWQPFAGHTQVPLWPAVVPEAQSVPGPEAMVPQTDSLVAGRPWMAVSNVSKPTLTIYSPKGKNTGAAVMVFPGGGFQVLAIDLEGTEVCHWLTSNGLTCVLLKYRVPSAPYDWRCKCYSLDTYARSTQALEDAQRAIGLIRFHAKEWHINPHKVGVIGFSAGGYLVAEISTNFEHRSYSYVDAADKESARPDFAMAIYPGHLAAPSGLNPTVLVSSATPPTFLVQAENDSMDGVEQSLVYYTALAKVHVPVEMHLYAHGGHAFGLRPSQYPITGWPKLADAWLRTIGILEQ
jgi:acetyl esterase/lipase